MNFRFALLFLTLLSFTFALQISGSNYFSISSNQEIYRANDSTGNVFLVKTSTGAQVTLTNGTPAVLIFSFLRPGLGEYQLVDVNVGRMAKIKNRTIKKDWSNYLAMPDITIERTINCDRCEIIINTSFYVRNITQINANWEPWVPHNGMFEVQPVDAGDYQNFIEVHLPQQFKVTSTYDPSFFSVLNDGFVLSGTQFQKSLYFNIPFQDEGRNAYLIPFFWAFFGAAIPEIIKFMLSILKLEKLLQRIRKIWKIKKS
jgi:hypothetical protein